MTGRFYVDNGRPRGHAINMRTIKLTESEVSRFYAKCRQVGQCIEYHGEHHKSALYVYGRFTFYRNGKRLRKKAHHVSFWLTAGRWPRKDRVIRHQCDNPLCVRHVEEGTQRQNVADMVGRGRAAWQAK